MDVFEKVEDKNYDNLIQKNLKILKKHEMLENGEYESSNSDDEETKDKESSGKSIDDEEYFENKKI